MADRIDREELRLLIREALKEALGESPPASRTSDKEVGSRSERRPSHSPDLTPERTGAPFSLRSGVLTEAKVAEAGKTHRRIKIASNVAVTPLARDRARQMKIEIVREEP